MKIEITKIYPDKELRRHTVKGEIITVSEKRGNFLIEKGLANPFYSDNLEYQKQIEELTNMVKEKDEIILERDSIIKTKNKETELLQKELEKLQKQIEKSKE